MTYNVSAFGQAILAAKFSGAELDSYIQTSEGLKAWKILLKSRYLSMIFAKPEALALLFESGTALAGLLAINGAAIAADDGATASVAASGSALLTVVSDPALFNLWNNTPANKARLQALVNQSGSMLCREVFTSSGTWTHPAGGILALSLFGVGKGGNGTTSNNPQGGGGGGGGGIKWAFYDSSLPSSDVTVTISGTTSFGAILTFESGGGASGTSGGTGGSTTTGSAITDATIDTALFQIATGSQQGGVGGNGAYFSPSSGGNGGGGLGGTGGGTGGFGNPSSPYTAQGGQGGTGIGAGGGGGGSSGSGGSGSAASSGYGNGGGGAASAGGGGFAAGNNGKIVAYWIKAS